MFSGSVWNSLRLGFLRGSRWGKLQAAWRMIDGVVRRGTFRLPLDPPRLLRVASLAAQYGERQRALEWSRAIEERCRSGRRGPSRELGVVCELARVTADLAAKEYESAERRIRRLERRPPLEAPWAANVWLMWETWTRSRRSARSRLRRRSADGKRTKPEPYELGNRFRILGLRAFQSGQWGRGMALYRAAGREFGKDGFLDARLREAEALGACGMGAYQMGKLEEAEAYYREAIERAERYRHSFSTGALKLQLALVHADRECYARAIALTEEVAREALARGGREATDRFLLTSAHISTASYEVDAGNVGAAEAALEKAGGLLDKKEHWRYRGYWHMNRGRLKALDDPFRNRDAAFAEYEAADRCFRSRGSGDLLGLARTVLYRGALHLKLREVRDARAKIEECRQMTGIAGFRHVQSERLLLQSELLLERGLPAPHQVHEEVLRNLGVAARMPFTLFKVVANLYIYSWELDHDVDMLAWHLRQINRMARIFDRETFERLYDKYVYQRVIARFWPGGGALPPPFNGAEGSGPGAPAGDRGRPRAAR